MNMTVEEFFGVPKRIGQFGIEIEVEGAGLPMFPLNFWDMKQDGSLRGESAEYVFKKPLTKTSSMKAIAELNTAFKDAGTKLAWSNRCSTHVHINCTRLDMIQLMNFITTLYIFEDILVDWCGESRSGNLFCLTSKSAEGGLLTIADYLNTGVFKAVGDNIRYSAINLASLPKFGSVEIRSLRGTTDEEEIRTWLEVLESLYIFAKEFDTPSDLVQAFSYRGFLTMAEEALGKNYHKFINDEGDSDKKILSGIRQIQPIAFKMDWKDAFNPQKVKVANPFEEMPRPKRAVPRPHMNFEQIIGAYENNPVIREEPYIVRDDEDEDD